MPSAYPSVNTRDRAVQHLDWLEATRWPRGHAGQRGRGVICVGLILIRQSVSSASGFMSLGSRSIYHRPSKT